MNTKLLYAIVGAAIGALATWLLMTNSYEINTLQGTGNKGATDAIDKHFIEQMIPHHEDAITMGKLALTKAQNPELKQLATNIVDSQSQEITQMKSWYKQWYGADVPQGREVMDQHGMMGESTHMGMMGDSTDMTNLEQSADFDREFVREMIPHHQMAVMMAQMLKKSTSSLEMRQLADDIIDAQTTEIELMRGWLKTWK